MMIEMVHLTKNLKFKTAVLNTRLYDYDDAYIIVEGRITVIGQGSDAAEIAGERNNKETVFKNYTPFIKCINKINNAEVDNAKDLDTVMPTYN